MSIPPAVLVLVGVAVCGAALALAGFVWAVSTGQMDPDRRHGAIIFDEDDPYPAGGKRP